jgi:shikimate dehydrogenase
MCKAKYGLIGYPLSHSFSKKFYTEKFINEGIQDVEYDLFPIPSIQDFSVLLDQQPKLQGVNVTIPYKIEVMRFLDEIRPEAASIGAVNCIKIRREGDSKPKLIGYNTDVFGFTQSLQPLLQPGQTSALVLGNGGAAKAVCYGLNQLGIEWKLVSRTPNPHDSHQLSYEELNQEVLNEHLIIINTTPLGTFPEIAERPPIPYEFVHAKHLLYDLIYNPSETAFLQEGQKRGARIKNGYEMLVLQAEKNWEIWQSESEL